MNMIDDSEWSDESECRYVFDAVYNRTARLSKGQFWKLAQRVFFFISNTFAMVFGILHNGQIKYVLKILEI